MYESKNEKIIDKKQFVLRMLWHLLAAILLIIFTLVFGAIGHIYFENIPFHDAFLNTALIVGGIGTTVLPESIAGKVFFAAYGIFVGLIFAAIVGVALAPIIHRVVHRMHLDDD